jgi:hypothetical protein
LTGGVASSYFLMDFNIESFWQLIKNNGKSDTLMTASSNVLTGETHHNGILSQHAYTIVEVHDDDQLKLLKLRNPHVRRILIY